MKILNAEEIVRLHEKVIVRSGGMSGVKNFGLVQSAAAQPSMTFGGVDLYLKLHDKAGALAYSLAKNHAFEDGNKRIAQAAMETFLIRNGFEIDCTVDEQESVFLRLAAGELTRDELDEWICCHMIQTWYAG